ncbi:plasmid stabilization protein [Sphingobium sp. C100]|uniref:type II toxin-antitoxin system RelE/ParE family toxin n=1 Tax=Sphingobium sp. C100 TaxID=1207055 RepID=UPI0003D66A33|nr:type II toxin-antitoxin system RelE/ParE family toxin [Sphingobium sp. C100]ETI63339.1 plasmid stabilization protein [Sphingobium sp. C100]
MSAKPVVPRTRARTDVDSIIDHYLREAGADMALRFVDALEAGYGALSSRPGAGSPRFAHELGLPGLRSRSVGRFPYLIFYVEQPDHIDVWRILHTRRDIAEWLGAD